MDRGNGLHFKLVYKEWREWEGERSPIANGLDSAYVEYTRSYRSDRMIDFIHDGLRDPIFDQSYFQHQSGNIFRNGVFYHHVSKKYGQDIFISVDDVNDDGSTYIFPIEIERSALEYISRGYTFRLNDKEYRYTFEDALGQQVLDLLRSKKMYLFLTNLLDPMTGKHWELALNKFIELGIDQEQVIFMWGNVPTHYSPEKFKCKFFTDDLALKQMADLITEFPRTTDLGYVSDKVVPVDLNPQSLRSKKFISLNRSMDRDHRVSLMYTILKHDALDQGYFSFLNYFPEQPDRQILTSSQIDKDVVDKMSQLIPYQLDTQHLTEDRRYSFATFDSYKKDFYIDSYLHIVTETTFDDNATVFTSEKTWRPILMMQPFIFLGPWRALEKMRGLGFKTFSPFIDESYDDERDPRKRYQMIEKEIIKFINMDLKDLHSWYYSITDILIHNQNNIYNYTNYFIYSNFFNTEQL